jgi:hypothetical protein
LDKKIEKAFLLSFNFQGDFITIIKTCVSIFVLSFYKHQHDENKPNFTFNLGKNIQDKDYTEIE